MIDCFIYVLKKRGRLKVNTDKDKKIVLKGEEGSVCKVSMDGKHL